jgi:hypothetical protein
MIPAQDDNVRKSAENNKWLDIRMFVIPYIRFYKEIDNLKAHYTHLDS